MGEAIAVRPVTLQDWELLTGVLARAFEHDPCMAWVFRDDDTRVDHLRLLFDVAIPLFETYGISYTTADRASAALWAPPQHWRTPDEVVEVMAPKMAEAYGDETLLRLLTFFGTTEAKHPDADHYYLAVLATDQGRQGQGLGSANMRPVLQRADAESLPCYLESSNERNVPLYERHGFEVTEIVHLPDGPPIWLMWRPAGAGAGAGAATS